MGKQIQIVGTNFILRYFRQIEIFTIDLGSTLKQLDAKPGEAPKIKVKDVFVKKYESINRGKYVQKYGSIGSIVFYEDNTLSRFEFHIYKEDQIYEVQAEPEDLKKSANDYLTSILKSIDKDPYDLKDQTDQIKDIVYTNIPEGMNTPDINLPRDQYIEALVNRRILEEKIKNQK